MRHKYSSNFAFNDILFNILLLFVFLFVIAVLLMNPPTKKADIPTKAEFIIIMEWTHESKDDIDLWVQYEETPPVGYKNKSAGGLHLERDDLGHKLDTVTINGEVTDIVQNREAIVVRGVIPGNYYVGTFFYRAWKGQHGNNDVKVTVIDVNPYREVYTKQITMTDEAESVNFPGFYIDQDGEITEIFEHHRNLGPRNENNPTGRWN